MTGVNERIRDPIGTTVALLAGALVGILLAAPMLPRTPPGVDITVSPVGAALLAGSLAVVAIPICVLVLYLAVSRIDR